MTASKSWHLLPFGMLAVVCLAGGCVVGQQIRYDSAAVSVRQQGQGMVGLATQDRRVYVVSGKRTPDYVGVQRSGLGIPYPVRTGSEQPLAGDMSAVLRRALSQRGYRVTPIIVEPGTTAGDLAQKIRATGLQHSLVLYIDQWESDTFTDIGLEYDLTLLVVSGAGKIMAKASDSGSKRLEGSAWDPVAASQESLPKSLAKKLTKLVNAPQVAKAIQDATERAAQRDPFSGDD